MGTLNNSPHTPSGSLDQFFDKEYRMKSFKGFLTEGKLSYADLAKTRSGSERGQIIHQWIKDKKPVKIAPIDKIINGIIIIIGDSCTSSILIFLLLNDP